MKPDNYLNKYFVKQDLILRFWVKAGLRVRHLDEKNNRKELKDSRTPEKVVQADLEPEI